MSVFVESDKYPSTPHLPFSPGRGDGDTIMSFTSAGALFCEEVIITEKLDGGNCCIARGKVYARTHKHEATHPWFGTIKAMHHVLSATQADPTLELFGENMTATHSIAYENLTHYFYLFGARRAGVWASWEEIEALAENLGIPTPPLRFQGRLSSMAQLQQLVEGWMREPSGVGTGVTPEGFVVRVAGRFGTADFCGRAIAKFVRAGHVQTGDDFHRVWPRNKAVLGKSLPPRAVLRLSGPLPRPSFRRGEGMHSGQASDAPEELQAFLASELGLRAEAVDRVVRLVTAERPVPTERLEPIGTAASSEASSAAAAATTVGKGRAEAADGRADGGGGVLVVGACTLEALLAALRDIPDEALESAGLPQGPREKLARWRERGL